MKLASIFVLLAVTPAVAESPKPVAKAPAETTAEKAGRAFLKTSIESVDAIALPKAGLQYFFTLPGSTKGCESLTTGTAKAAAEATKLKTCIAAAYKAIGQGGAVSKIGVA